MYQLSVRAADDVQFRPVQTIGPVTVGEVDGKVALVTTTPLGYEWVWVLPVVFWLLPVVLYILQAAIWWWASSDLKFADISKIIGLLNPFFGVVAEALIK